MENKVFFSLLFFIFAVFLLLFYWFIPLNTTEFFLESGPIDSNSNYSNISKQFYNNMRFPNQKISYKIDQCPLQKKDDMLRAFNILEEKTVLDFYEVVFNEEISVTCDSRAKIEGGLFIAGEGGPTNITSLGEFNVITHGKILLLKDSSCPYPNVAIHELLHVLGFDHSSNREDVMYPVSNCNQLISQEVIDTLNSLYSIPSHPDLAFEGVSAVMHGKYLDANMSIRNLGFQNSLKTKIAIYGDSELIKEIELDSLEIGNGRIISLTNVWVSQISVKELKFLILSSFDELKKENNEVLLKIKK